MMTKLSILLALLILPAVSSAQETLPEGARIRVTQSQRAPITATLRSMSADSVTFVDASGRQHSLAQNEVVALQKSLGRERRFWKHLGIGIGATTAVGGAISALTWEECTETGFLSCFMEPETRGEAFVLGALVGAVIGIPIGALAGATIRVERWEPVILRGGESRLEMGRKRMGNRFALSASFAVF